MILSNDLNSSKRLTYENLTDTFHQYLLTKSQLREQFQQLKSSSVVGDPQGGK